MNVQLINLLRKYATKKVGNLKNRNKNGADNDDDDYFDHQLSSDTSNEKKNKDDD